MQKVTVSEVALELYFRSNANVITVDIGKYFNISSADALYYVEENEGRN